ncbi:MAG TPA: hypothetical protein VFA15_01835 [Nitrososphaera sp.]|nr:hypothetical protein [Nitrososphaera sp.]
MATALLTPRVIEYPADLTGCKTLRHENRDLLYYLIKSGKPGTDLVVVLGYLSGQVQDPITKDLIESVQATEKAKVVSQIQELLASQGIRPRILFL